MKFRTVKDGMLSFKTKLTLKFIPFMIVIQKFVMQLKI